MAPILAARSMPLVDVVKAVEPLLTANSLPPPMTVETVVVVPVPLTRELGNTPIPTADTVVIELTAVLVRVLCNFAMALPDSSICVLALLLRSKEFAPDKPATSKIPMIASAMDTSTMV